MLVKFFPGMSGISAVEGALGQGPAPQGSTQPRAAGGHTHDSLWGCAACAKGSCSYSRQAAFQAA